MSSAANVEKAHVEAHYERIPDVAAECSPNFDSSLLSDEAVLSIARRAGMLVMLDGRIGRETYQSVTGSLSSLQRFAADLRSLVLDGAAQ